MLKTLRFIVLRIVHLESPSLRTNLFATKTSLALAVMLAVGFGTTRAAHAQTTYKVLHDFDAVLGDGGTPTAGLVRDSSGNFFGTTLAGGTYDFGTVFKLDSAGKETVLYSFTGGMDGISPEAPLIQDAAGNLYGTATSSLDFGGVGNVFKLDTAGNQTVLYSFGVWPDGGYPYGPLIRDAAGNLYGTTRFGGDFFGCSCGVVFKLSPTGQETVLHTFAGFPTDGGEPFSGLIGDAAGSLYGTTYNGGVYAGGTIFKVDRSGKEAVHSFTGGRDGANPNAGLIRDAAGRFYGATTRGGVYGAGTLFKAERGRLIVLYSFTGGADGANPTGTLTQDGAGNLYGSTTSGGLSSFGTIFKLDSAGKETVLHNFSGGTDGANPNGGLIRDRAGNLYGTAALGGGSESGVVFELSFP